MTEEPRLETLKEIRGLSDDQIVDRISGYFSETEQRSTDASRYPLRARILIQESFRRDQDKQARVMIWFTITITVLTVCLPQ